MPRETTGGRPLHGQLLFADVDRGTLTLDCILALDGRDTGSPVTFSARLANADGTAFGRAVGLLLQWADEGAPVEVTFANGAAGGHVQITSKTKRVVLIARAP